MERFFFLQKKVKAGNYFLQNILSISADEWTSFIRSSYFDKMKGDGQY